MTCRQVLTTYMQRHKMPQKELAPKLGISRAYLNDLLHERRELSVLMAVRIADVCGHSAWEMLSEQLWRQLQEA